MKLWVTVVAVALLASVGAEPPTDPPPSTPSAAPPEPQKSFWGALEGGRGENSTLRRIRLWVTALGTRVQALSSALRTEMADVGQRALDYGADAKATLELGWAELRNRGASYARKLRKRLHRDGEELRRRWQGLGRIWGAPQELGDSRDLEEPQ
ncbi:apolipoprotein E-like [Cuculus canorus]|uniref:apolipoprotein E-like n=1 Tax=Cuculus canorus TaxID=55661 RepID=UPI0023AAE7C8|nr:apolipoprotein E-like [Cuculus canorus]